MAQNVRGQTLIDAIVQVFQEAVAERALTAADVARRLRAGGFWGGKEPKAADQMVESYLSTRHAGMFEPGPGGTFALKSVFLRPAARAAAAAAAVAAPIRPVTATAARPAARPAPGVAPARVAPSATLASPADARAGDLPAQRSTEARKKRQSFGGAAVAYFAPADAERSGLPDAINVHLSFEEAMKLHLSLGQLLAKLNGQSRTTKAGRRAAAMIRVNLAKRRVAVYERHLKRGSQRVGNAAPGTADWGVEPG